MTTEAVRPARGLFDGERLTLARQLRGLRKVDLAERVAVSAAAISQYESGVTMPSSQTLVRLSIALGLPPRFFEYGRPLYRSSEAAFHFRRVEASTKAERAQLLATTSLAAEVVHWLERWVELPSMSLPEPPSRIENLVDAEAAAASVRAEWDLGFGPIENMVTLLEAKGCLVLRLHADTGRVDAFSGWLAGRPWVVLTNDKNDAARSRFDASHELGHLVLHPDVEPGDRVAEAQAHRFASSFLLPAESIRRELPSAIDWRRLVDLKKRWGVSLQALLRRAMDLGIFSEHTYGNAMRYISRKGWRTHEPGYVGQLEEPTLLSDALQVAATEFGLELTSLTDAIVLDSAHLREVFGDQTWLKTA